MESGLPWILTPRAAQNAPKPVNDVEGAIRLLDDVTI